MPPEKLTGTGSSTEWATFEERDAVFEDMREKAVKSIDPTDLISIEMNEKLLDREMNYNFENSNSALSSVVKNVIWGLWEYKEARENLFPKHLLPKKKEGQTDEEAEAEAEKKLAKFIDDKSQHQTPEGKALINFVILAIRSGFKGMPLKRRIEEHIATQFEHFLGKYFEDWMKVLKDKKRKFDPDKYTNDDERESARKKFEQESKYRFRLLTLAKNSEQLHSQIFSYYSQEGSMNVFGYFLRQLLNVEQAGGKVKEIMIGVVDKEFDVQRKNFLDLLDKLRNESKEKTAKEKEARKAIDDVSDGVAKKAVTSMPKTEVKKAAHVTPTPGKVVAISGQEIPTPAAITEPDTSDTDVDDLIQAEESEADLDYLTEDSGATPGSDFAETENSGVYSAQPDEETKVFEKKPRVIIRGRKRTQLPETAYLKKSDEIHHDEIITPVPAVEDATADEKSDNEKSDTERSEDSGHYNVIPPIPGIALKTPVPPKPKPLPASLQERIQQAAAKPEPDPKPKPAAESKKNRVEDVTVPDLPAIQAELGEPEKAILAEADPKKRAEKMQSWVAEHPKSIRAVFLVLAVAVVGGAGYLAYKYGYKKNKTQERTSVAVKTTTDDKSKQVITSLPKDMKEPIMAAPMAAPMARPMAAPMATPMARPVMKAPVEVMKASMDVMQARPAPKPRPAVKPQPTPRPRTAPAPTKTVDVKGAQANSSIAFIDTKTIDDLPAGTYKEMWEGKAFDVQDAPFASISGFMEQKLKGMIKTLPKKERYKAMRGYYKELRQLERGWLIYMSVLEKNLQEKAMKGNLTAKEDAQLKYWESYKKTHRARGWQAKWLTRRYEKLMKSKKKGHGYYKGLYARGAELMEGLAELNPHIDDPNQVPQGQKVKFANGKKVLKTFWRFAHAMNLQRPEKGMSSTGSIDEGPQHIMFAEHYDRLDGSDMFDVQPDVPTPSKGLATTAPEPPKAFGSVPMPELKPVLGGMLAKKPPRIPKDARVYQISPEDIIEEKMLKPQDYGSAPMPELKPVLGKIFADRKKPPAIPEDALPKIKDEDILEVRNITPPPIPVDDSQIIYEKDIAPEPPMYGAAPLPKEIKPILGVKPPAIPADAIPSTYDIPRGEGPETPPEYASITDDRMPKVGPPPIPAMADVPKEKPKKKSLFARAKKWLLG